MFKVRSEYKTQLAEKSAEVGETLAERLHELSKQAEKQAGALESRVKKPRRKRRVLRALAWATLLIPVSLGIAYGLRRLSQSDRTAGTPFDWKSNMPGSPASRDPSHNRTVTEDKPAETPNVAQPPAAATSNERPPSRSGPRNVPSMAFQNLVGKEVVDLNGHGIGEAKGVYFRGKSGEAEWIIVDMGLLDREIKAAPLDGATIEEKIQLACPEDLVKGAPDFGEALTLEDELALYGHYSVRRTLPDDVPPLENDPLKRWLGTNGQDANHGTNSEMDRSDTATGAAPDIPII